ncbi:hypothetical protein VP01_632g1 [Puccinia sorghi]|uniref:Uncharacterized protein n=1 Tax=Puccinia sorghi TaxID=27349 RepID=A0A0L6UG69_9BASI|nr:hypothetical protein VP01_632g1 [Puccinia sorghi]
MKTLAGRNGLVLKSLEAESTYSNWFFMCLLDHLGNISGEVEAQRWLGGGKPDTPRVPQAVTGGLSPSSLGIPLTVYKAVTLVSTFFSWLIADATQPFGYLISSALLRPVILTCFFYLSVLYITDAHLRLEIRPCLCTKAIVINLGGHIYVLRCSHGFSLNRKPMNQDQKPHFTQVTLLRNKVVPTGAQDNSIFPHRRTNNQDTGEELAHTEQDPGPHTFNSIMEHHRHQKWQISQAHPATSPLLYTPLSQMEMMNPHSLDMARKILSCDNLYFPIARETFCSKDMSFMYPRKIIILYTQKDHVCTPLRQSPFINFTSILTIYPFFPITSSSWLSSQYSLPGSKGEARQLFFRWIASIHQIYKTQYSGDCTTTSLFFFFFLFFVYSVTCIDLYFLFPSLIHVFFVSFSLKDVPRGCIINFSFFLALWESPLSSISHPLCHLCLSVYIYVSIRKKPTKTYIYYPKEWQHGFSIAIHEIQAPRVSIGLKYQEAITLSRGCAISLVLVGIMIFPLVPKKHDDFNVLQLIILDSWDSLSEFVLSFIQFLNHSLLSLYQSSEPLLSVASQFSSSFLSLFLHNFKPRDRKIEQFSLDFRRGRGLVHFHTFNSRMINICIKNDNRFTMDRLLIQVNQLQWKN